MPKLFEGRVCPLAYFVTYSGNVKLITARQEASTLLHVLLHLGNTSLLELAKSRTADSALVTQTPAHVSTMNVLSQHLSPSINALFILFFNILREQNVFFDTCIRILCPGVGLLYANVSLSTLDGSTLSLLSRDISLTSA